MIPMAPPLALVYRSLWRAAGPLVRWYVRRKDARRLVDARATQERFGRSVRPRSWDGSAAWVLWIHGASVGECLSALPVVEFVLSPRCAAVALPPEERRVVVTTTTAAARQLLQRRLNSMDTLDGRAVCVFAPLDAPTSVARFYDVWRPNAGLWVESELWPTLIFEASQRKIPIGLLNARISPQSMRWWSLPLVRSFIRDVVARFSLVLCQDATNQLRFSQLGARAPRVAANLKFASTWQASDGSGLAALQHSLQGRTVWLAVSTHEGEELLMAGVHDRLSRRATSQPLLTVIIPRHPERAATITQQLQQSYPGLRISRRSTHGVPSADADIFIADTLGETGLFFDAISTVVMGGTFEPRGGHNPIEPLRAGCNVALGPYAFNFSDILQQLQPYGRFVAQVETMDQLSDWLTQHVNRENRAATQTVMKTLSVQAMATYETALVEWLAADKKTVTKE